MLRSGLSSIRKVCDIMSEKASRLIWIDCEMTGLDHNKQTLVEIAVVVTDKDLNVIAEGPDIVIHQPESVLNNMESWPHRVFKENGLMERIQTSKTNMASAENQVLEFLERETEKGKCPLAGNSVYVDRMFIQKYMPRLDAHMHYRIIDVSTIKELSSRWYPLEFKNAPKKTGRHRALDDIRESILELQFYRQSVFRK